MADGTLYLLRLGAELTIKSKRTRGSFLRTLRRNLRDALDSTGAPYHLEGEWARIYVRSPAPEAAAILARVFGVSSLSPVDAVVPARLDAIVEGGGARYAGFVAGKRFAVRARRAGLRGRPA